MFQHRSFAISITALATAALIAACSGGSHVTDASRVLPLEVARPNAGFPAVTFTPTSLSFGNIYVGNTSQPRLVIRSLYFGGLSLCCYDMYQCSLERLS